MTREELLLTILAEECCEVGQRVSKALRFGLDEVQPKDKYKDKPYPTNAHRIVDELLDLSVVWLMLIEEKILPNQDDVYSVPDRMEVVRLKKEKIEKYLKYSEECGRLDRREWKEDT